MLNNQHNEIKALSLELTEACNYKCKMCDYWQIKNPIFMRLDDVKFMLNLLKEHPIRNITITGGEPLLHPQWREITNALPAKAKKFLCTNGSPILIKNGDVGKLYDVITVSADGATEDTFEKIRGYRHLEKILKALEKIKHDHPNTQLELKLTIQRDNYHEIIAFFELAKECKFIDGVCFGIPDTSQLAFGKNIINAPEVSYNNSVMLTLEQTQEFRILVEEFYQKFAKDIENGFLVEGSLSRYVARFEAYNNMGQSPEPRNCRVNYNTIVLKANGTIKGCYFLEDTTTLDEVRKSENLVSHTSKLINYSPLTHPICRKCDQIDVINPIVFRDV